MLPPLLSAMVIGGNLTKVLIEGQHHHKVQPHQVVPDSIALDNATHQGVF